MNLPPRDLESYRSLRHSHAGAFLDDWRAVEFAGEDRLEWLQRQVTQDLTRLAQAKPFCLCDPSGRLKCVGWSFDDGRRSVLLVPEGGVEALLSRVEEAVFLEDVGVRLLDDRLWIVQGPEAAAEGIRFPVAAANGFAVLLPATQNAPAVPELTPEALRIGMLEWGTPRWGVDVNERTLPPEMGPAFDAAHVAYGKGCYTGQEVLMRIHSRGKASRRWVGLLGDGSMEQGVATVSGVEVGRVTSAAWSPELGYIAGAMLRAGSAKEGEIVSVITPNATVRAEVRQMPLLHPA